MNKVLVGLLVGAVLGLVDGLTAWFTPEARVMMVSIVIGSTIKGIMAGVAAGIFARKVRSVPAGIVFGLIVGLGLAYWVAAMQDKYYFEIMLPGSIVGAIVGWATQRYGKPPVTRSGVAATAMMLMLLTAATSQAGDAKVTATDAFAKLKTLAGKWDGRMLTPDGPPGSVIYKVSAGGHAVMETLFPDTPHEMITMYTLDGDRLIAQHYCSGDNQPKMALNPAKSSQQELVFDFVSVDGIRTHDHIHHGRITFAGDGKLVEEWVSRDHEGKEGPKRFYLSAAK